MLGCLPDAISPGLLYRPGWPHALCPVHGQVTADRLYSDISCRAWAQGDFLIANLLEGLAVLTFSEPDPANRDWKLHKACLHWCHWDRPCHLRVRNRRPKRRKKCRWREWDSRRRWAASMCMHGCSQFRQSSLQEFTAKPQSSNSSNTYDYILF